VAKIFEKVRLFVLFVKVILLVRNCYIFCTYHASYLASITAVLYRFSSSLSSCGIFYVKGLVYHLFSRVPIFSQSFSLVILLHSLNHCILSSVSVLLSQHLVFYQSYLPSTTSKALRPLVEPLTTCPAFASFYFTVFFLKGSFMFSFVL